MISLITFAAIAPAFCPSVENVKLIRSYKADENQAYSIHVDMDDHGTPMEINGEIVFKIKKATDDGAEISMAVRKFSMKREGNDIGSTGPDEMTSGFDKMGMPQVMSTNNEAWIYFLASIAGVVPGKEVAIGDGFDVDWTSKDKEIKAKGKGKATEIVDLDGTKAVKLEYELEVSPGHDTPGNLKFTTHVAQADSSPLSSEGTVKVEDSTFKFQIKRLKA